MLNAKIGRDSLLDLLRYFHGLLLWLLVGESVASLGGSSPQNIMPAEPIGIQVASL